MSESTAIEIESDLTAIEIQDFGFATAVPSGISIPALPPYRGAWSVALDVLRLKDFGAFQDSASAHFCVTPLKSSGLSIDRKSRESFVAPGTGNTIATPCKQRPTIDGRVAWGERNDFFLNSGAAEPHEILLSKPNDLAICGEVAHNEERRLIEHSAISQHSELGRPFQEKNHGNYVARVPISVATESSTDGCHDEVPALRTAGGSIVWADTRSREHAHHMLSETSAGSLANEMPRAAASISKAPENHSFVEKYDVMRTCGQVHVMDCQPRHQACDQNAIPETIDHSEVPVLRTAAGAPVLPKVGSLHRAQGLLVTSTQDKPSPILSSCDPMSRVSFHGNCQSVDEDNQCASGTNAARAKSPTRAHQIPREAASDELSSNRFESVAVVSMDEEADCDGNVHASVDELHHLSRTRMAEAEQHLQRTSETAGAGEIPLLRTAAGSLVSANTRSLNRAQHLLSANAPDVSAVEHEVLPHSELQNMREMRCAPSVSFMRTAAGSLVSTETKPLSSAQHLLSPFASDEPSAEHVSLSRSATSGGREMGLPNDAPLLGPCARTPFKPPRVTTVKPMAPPEAEPTGAFGAAARKQFKRPRIMSPKPMQ
mmetsp:Transcript_102710/g.162406  ORF Transcript_102710/g.162406 Transcript_102710/m.162406 type:complete len:601 (-) Transcript_102710:78-1880(-)